MASRWGLSWETAWRMHPTDRRAWLYRAAMMEGYVVDWETGKMHRPDKSAKS